MTSERGYTMIEMIVAIFVLVAASVATFAVFTSSKNTSLVAQRHEVAIAQAQKEIESLRSLGYDRLGLTKAPDPSNRLEASPDKLGYYGEGNTTVTSSFTVRSGAPAVSEHLVLPDSEVEGSVNPDPTTFDVGGSHVTGKVYRYVTWRPESCGVDGAGKPLCPGSRQTKRVIVAVTLDPIGHRALERPVWIGTVAVDPDAEPYE